MMDEPPVRYWLMGANEWRTAYAWPPRNVEWRKLYLAGWESLRPEPPRAASADDFVPPDSFLQMPLAQTNKVARLRYMTEPLAADLAVAGPLVLVLHAALDQPDTNWIVILKDIGPDVSVRSAREGEREIPADLPEREITRGWLKASHRAVDEARSRPGRPWHPLTRAAQKPAVPGEIAEYQIELLATANLFRRGHRIAIDITALDVPTGVAAATNAEYVPYHICSSRTVVHTIYHDPAHPSHLLLPVVPKEKPAD
jgi:putative CocE/NonD family hydrolase